MQAKRRIVVAAIGAVLLTACQSTPPAQARPAMYGLIGKIKIKPGQRDALAAILLKGTQGMPGCLSYIIANDPKDADALWITEVWIDAEHHRASLKLPSVQAALTEGRPMIIGFGERFETQPLGGLGL